MSQNLTVILNHARSLGMFPDFDTKLTNNFNHLMYAENLILISKASKPVAKNIKLCVSIYFKFISKNPNNSKSVIYFPKWLNKRLTRSISNTLDFNIGTFLSIYLSITIFLGKLPL